MPIYREQPASPSIARWVECGWFLQSGAAVTEHRVPPDGCLDIIYERGRGLIAVGTMTTEQRFSFPYGAYLTGIRFRPGMAGPFLGVSPSELTDGSVPLEDLWSRRASELKRRLDDANVIQDALRILLDHIPTPTGTWCISGRRPVRGGTPSATSALGGSEHRRTFGAVAGATGATCTIRFQVFSGGPKLLVGRDHGKRLRLLQPGLDEGWKFRFQPFDTLQINDPNLVELCLEAADGGSRRQVLGI